MELSGYSLSIPEGRELENGYVEMTHCTVYSIALRNLTDRRCAVSLTIDGSDVGRFQISKNRIISIHRPVHDDGCLTFYQLDSKEATQSEIGRSTETGLVTASFVPEMERPRALSSQAPRLDSEFSGTSLKSQSLVDDDEQIVTLDSHAAGGTGLFGKSNQQFTIGEPLCLDHSAQVTIRLRLICRKESPRPLRKLSTPIPPPLT